MVNPPSEQFQLSQKLAIFRDKKKITKSDLNHIYQMYETKGQYNILFLSTLETKSEQI